MTNRNKAKVRRRRPFSLTAAGALSAIDITGSILLNVPLTPAPRRHGGIDPVEQAFALADQTLIDARPWIEAARENATERQEFVATADPTATDIGEAGISAVPLTEAELADAELAGTELAGAETAAAAGAVFDAPPVDFTPAGYLAIESLIAEIESSDRLLVFAAGGSGRRRRRPSVSRRRCGHSLRRTI